MTSENQYVPHTQATTAYFTDQIQDPIHPLDGVHQIIWVAR